MSLFIFPWLCGMPCVPVQGFTEGLEALLKSTGVQNCTEILKTQNCMNYGVNRRFIYHTFSFGNCECCVAQSDFISPLKLIVTERNLIMQCHNMLSQLSAQKAWALASFQGHIGANCLNAPVWRTVRLCFVLLIRF